MSRRTASVSRHRHAIRYWRVARVVIVTETPISKRIIPTIAHANQLGIKALSHLTAPTATNPTPIIAITTPARINPTERAKPLMNPSTGFAALPRASRRMNLTSFLTSSDRSGSGN